MSIYRFISRTTLVAFVLGLTVQTPAFADKPDWAGGGKGGKHGDHDEYKGGKKHKSGPSSQNAVQINIGGYFGSSQRQLANDFYGAEFRAGHCPKGLAKKHNGCMPPGQAKKWALGKPLPSSVTYYSVPAGVVARIGAPPAGYKYVRVAADILMIAVGTSMVVDAIEDLGSM